MRVIVKPFEWIAALFSLPAFGLMMIGLVNPRGYSAGMRNADAPFYFIEGFMFVAGAMLALTGVIWVLATWGRSSKATHIFGIIVAGLPVVLAMTLLIFPLHTYRRGLTRWAATHVSAIPIREWMAAGPTTSPAAAPVPPAPTPGAPPIAPMMMPVPSAPLAGATQIELTNCPADISAMAPQYVWLTPGKRGVILVWTGGMWGDGRGIFIGLDAGEPPPAGIGGWMRALPGVYATDKVPTNLR